MAKLTGISHTVLTVANLDRSVPWYERVLSCSSIFRGRSEPGGFEVAYLSEPSSGLLLGLVQHDAPQAESFSPRVVGLDHLAFAVENRNQLTDWATHLDSAGIPHGPLEDQPFGTGLTVADPDGIALEFYHLSPPSATK
ncbi:MAG: VOC family protein [Tepidiformaceae bacterium]